VRSARREADLFPAKQPTSNSKQAKKEAKGALSELTILLLDLAPYLNGGIPLPTKRTNPVPHPTRFSGPGKTFWSSQNPYFTFVKQFQPVFANSDAIPEQRNSDFRKTPPPTPLESS
jgi:hypothetical protein